MPRSVSSPLVTRAGLFTEFLFQFGFADQCGLSLPYGFTLSDCRSKIGFEDRQRSLERSEDIFGDIGTSPASRLRCATSALSLRGCRTAGPGVRA